MAASKTPVMLQHAAAKRAYPDAIVLFRLGDFYEMFGEDAVLCAKLLDLTLTSRNKGKSDEVPMAGVPHHAAHGYIGRLLAAGYKVAICEQMADPSTVKGIVPRPSSSTCTTTCCRGPRPTGAPCRTRPCPRRCAPPAARCRGRWRCG